MMFSRPTHDANRVRRSAMSSGGSTTLVPWLTTPGTSTLPGGSFTSCHTFHSCSWRGLAASIRYAPALTLRIRSTIFVSGTSVVCGPGQLPQQT